MTEPDDHQLFAEFARENSEAAFSALVSRHINLVYSTALRSVGNTHAAEEITQAVFIILARKAKSLSRKIVLSGCLYQTTRLTAANFLRTEIRRQKREQEAYMQSTLNEPEAWRQIAPLLDDAISRLGEKDRNAVVLRFFENKNLQEVGLALGASEDAAKMRVNRALEKLRKFFTKRSVTFSAAAIAEVVSANSVQAAPVALAKSVTAAAMTKGIAASGSTLTLIKGALKIMAWTKAKMAIAVGAGILLAVGTTTVTVKEIQEHRTYPWQVPNANSDVLRRVPPQVGIAPAKYPHTMGAGNVSINDGGIPNSEKMMGIALTFEGILMPAYGQSLERTVFLTKVPSGQFDYIPAYSCGLDLLVLMS
jgi:RNA polymerase sigma factor (sigma-70 family)